MYCIAFLCELDSYHLLYFPNLFFCKTTYWNVCVRLCVYVCRYRLAGLPGDYQEKNISSPETNYCLLKDLIIWTQYQIQVAAYTGAGLGVYSSPVTEYTLQGGKYAHTFISQSKYTKSFWEVFNHCSICTLLNIKYCDTVELVTQEELFLGPWIFKYGPEKTSHQSHHTLWALTYEQTLCIM